MDKQYEESLNQFEKYFEGFYGYHPTDSYDQSHVEKIWHTWQHSRASIVVELPEIVGYGMINRGEILANLRSIGLSIKGEK
ncbi:hypothetical protein [Serratia marcescens]|uniref:hypothetical protein n=1 Tax=Serratia marcescens TaxID=615 RepID=UPI0034E849D7